VALDSTRSSADSEPVELIRSVGDKPHRVETATNVLYLALGQVGTTTLGIVFSAVLARTLGASDFGLYFLVTSMAAFAYTIVEWGQPLLLVREMARDPQHVGELLGSGLALRVLASAILSVPLLLIAYVLGYGAWTVSIVALYFAAMLPISLAQGYGTVFRAFRRMGSDALVAVLNSAAALALVLLALQRGGGLVAIGLCQFVAGVISLVVARQLYARQRATPLALTRGMVRHLWRGGVAIMSISVLQAAQPYLDVLILSKLVPTDAIGYFGVARSIMGVLLAPAVILATATFPQLSRAAKTPDQFGSVVRNALRPMMFFGALASVGTYLFAQTAVELKVISILVSTALDFILIPWFQARYGNGGLGVIVAFALSELIMFAGLIAMMPRGVLRLESIVEAAKAIGAAVVTLVLLRSIPALPPAAGIPVNVVVFFAVAFALKLVDSSDLVFLKDIPRRRCGSRASRQS
jgi:O-antigen/teichoic acid export membrane protein